MKKLYNLSAEEVSLVDKGANKKKFLIFKSRGGNQMPAKNISREVREMMNMPPKVAANLEKVVKEMAHPHKSAAGDMPPKKDSAVFKGPEHEEHGLSERAQAALKAVGRILHPHKDEIQGHHLGAVAHEVGIGDHSEEQPGEVEGKHGSDGKMGKTPMHQGEDEIEMSVAYPEDVEEEHHSEAVEMAKKAYKAHLDKMGYRKYPDEEVAQKGKKLEDDEDEDESEEEEEHVGKNVKKAAGSLDLSAFPKEQRPHLEMIFKSNRELVQKNLDLEKQIKDRDAREREREIVQKAAEFNNVALPQEEIIETLKDADKLGAKSFERVCKQFETLNEQGRSSNLFREIGTSQSAEGAGSAEAKLDALVNSIVQKSGSDKSKEQIYDEVIQTPEGKRLYRESQQKRFGGGR